MHTLGISMGRALAVGSGLVPGTVSQTTSQMALGSTPTLAVGS